MRDLQRDLSHVVACAEPPSVPWAGRFNDAGARRGRAGEQGANGDCGPRPPRRHGGRRGCCPRVGFFGSRLSAREGHAGLAASDSGRGAGCCGYRCGQVFGVHPALLSAVAALWSLVPFIYSLPKVPDFACLGSTIF